MFNPRLQLVKSAKTGSHFVVTLLWKKGHERQVSQHNITFSNAIVGSECDGWKVIKRETHLIKIEGE